MSKVIAFTNQKGGVGKTTSAISLAAALGEAGQKVLLLDFDPQGNATSGVLPEFPADQPTVYDLICGKAAAEDCIIPDVSEGLDLMPSNIDLSGAEVELLGEDTEMTRLRQSIEPVREQYDYILIDCPPSIGVLTVNGLVAADTAIIPVQCEYFALEGLSQVLNTIEIVRHRLNPDLEIEGVLFTMYDSRTKLSEQVVQSVRDSLDESIFETMIPRNVRLAEAPSHGMPITVYDSGSRGADSYRQLAAELMEMQ